MGGGHRVRVGAGLGETDAEANRYHEPAAPSKPATAAELHGGAGTPADRQLGQSAAAATSTLDALLGTAAPPRDPVGVRTGETACKPLSLSPRVAHHRNPPTTGP
jgi:hypothetical protein